MFYAFIKVVARCCLLLFCRRKIVIGHTLSNLQRPAIIAANHPNSMLDAIIIACECNQPVHFTIRSDMFKNPLFRFLLKYLNGIPVYRASEAKGQLRENFTSFSKCKEVLSNGGIIIIFSEGVTLHDWKLKPFKSGTAKLVSYVLQDQSLRDRLQVATVGLTYSDYEYIGKTIIIQSAPVFLPGEEIQGSTGGVWKQDFNEILYQHMRPLVADMDSDEDYKRRCWQVYLDAVPATEVYESSGQLLQQTGKHIAETDIPKTSFSKHNRYDYTNKNNLWKLYTGIVLLSIPAITGWLLNALYYYPVTQWCRYKTRGSIFFDALAFGIYLGTYPLYVLLVSLIVSRFTATPFLLWIILLPLTGWITIVASRWTRRIINYHHSNKAERDFFDNLLKSH